MTLLKLILGATATSILTMFIGIIILIPTITESAAMAIAAQAGVLAIGPSDYATEDIPAQLMPIYIEASSRCQGLPWTVIAAIGKVESNHARHAGSNIITDGRVVPPIIGIRLDGTNGTATIRDTDNGRTDGDTVWDRAVGPFQFIPSSWAIFGVDGNGDGVADPHNLYDAIPSAVRHLCPNGKVEDLHAAVFSYNHSIEYVRLVLDWAARYTGTVSAIPVAGYAAPINGLTETQATRPHHDYPAIDIATPIGTPVFAMVDGTLIAAVTTDSIYDGTNSRCGNTIIIEGTDNVRYTYCHLSAVTVTSGQTAVAGQQLGLTGGQPGSPGAGNTTGPHLHLSMTGGGRSLCPQPVILSILLGTPINPLVAPSSGCVNDASIDWNAWLEKSTSIK